MSKPQDPRGMVFDASPIDQPEGTASFVLNGAIEEMEGDILSYSTEPATVISESIYSGHQVMGSINIDEFNVALFSTDGTLSVIYMFNRGKLEYTVEADLGFDICYPIKGKARVIDGCNRQIYFYDGLNEDRQFNFDAQENYWTLAYKTWVEGGEIGIAPAKWDRDKFSLRLKFCLPSITTYEIRNTGGSIELGSYRHAFRYLDSDLNETRWFSLTPSHQIHNDELHGAYVSIDGGFNINTKTAEEGAVPPTPKSIYYVIDNLDRKYSFLEVAVIAKRTGDNITKEAYIVDRLQIVAGSLEYVFTGIDEANDTLTTVSDIVSYQANWKTSSSMEIFENRLIRGGVVEPSRDYAILQQAANNIQARYFTKEVKVSSNSLGEAKNEGTTKSMLSFMRDEVYDFAIVFQYEDGSMSPAFHIPGRPIDHKADASAFPATDPNGFVTAQSSAVHNRPDYLGATPDTDTIPGGGANTEFLDSGIATTDFDRWEVFNTAQRDVYQHANGNHSEGELAYFQSNKFYPNTLDCDGNRIYPEGNQRFHRMPDSTLEPHYIGSDDSDEADFPDQGHWTNNLDTTGNNAYIFPMGVSFSNINVPPGLEICSYRIVYKRLNSVAMKGVIFNPTNAAGLISSNLAFPTTTMWPNNAVGNFVQFYSPEQYFNKEGFTPNNMVIERRYHSPIDSTDPAHHWVMGKTGIPFGYLLPAGNSARVYNRAIRTYAYIDQLFSTKVFGATITNVNNNDVMLIGLKTGIQAPNQGVEIFGNRYIYYASIKNNIDETDFIASVYHDITPDPVSVSSILHTTHGDTFITRLDINHYQFDETDPLYPITTKAITTFWTESDMNAELRHASASDTSSSYYPVSNNSRNMPDNAPLTNLYNPDYTATPSDRIYVPLPYNYDWCDNCSDHDSSNVIAYSEQVIDGENKDSFREFLANNFTTITGDTGSVTQLWKKSRTLFVNTSQALYRMNPNASELQSTSDTIYIGTGSLFSIPPRRVIETDTGYGGCQTKFALKTTEYGTFWVDQANGRVYRYGESLEVISDHGMRKWLQNNLPSNIERQFSAMGETYDCDDSFDCEKGHGLFIEYDPLVKRIIIHKKDYDTFTPMNVLEDNSPTLGTIQWSRDDGNFYYWDGTDYNLTKFSEQDYFINKCWTLSYSLITKKWASFHSWMPAWMFRDAQRLYSSPYGNTIYSHDYNTIASIYGTIHPFILEVVQKNPKKTKLDSFSWLTRVHRLDFLTSQPHEQDTTFTGITVYNDKQSTGEVALTTKSTNQYDLTWDPTSVVLRREKGYWVANGLRDQVVSRGAPTVNSFWYNTAFRGYFNATSCQGYIDKVVNANVISGTKSMYEQEQFDGTWQKIRLTYTNPGIYGKFVVDLLSASERPSKV